MSGTTLEVNRSVLLAKLRGAKVEAGHEYRKALSRYPGEIERWNTRVARELVKLAGRMNGKSLVGVFDSDYRGRVTVKVPVALGPMPTKPSLDTCRIDRAIEVVSLTKSDVFRLRTDDPILALIVADRC